MVSAKMVNLKFENEPQQIISKSAEQTKKKLQTLLRLKSSLKLPKWNDTNHLIFKPVHVQFSHINGKFRPEL